MSELAKVNLTSFVGEVLNQLPIGAYKGKVTIHPAIFWVVLGEGLEQGFKAFQMAHSLTPEYLEPSVQTLWSDSTKDSHQFGTIPSIFGFYIPDRLNALLAQVHSEIEILQEFPDQVVQVRTTTISLLENIESSLVTGWNLARFLNSFEGRN